MYSSENIPVFSNKRDFETFIAGDAKKATEFVNNLYNEKTQISKNTISGKKLKLTHSLSGSDIEQRTETVLLRSQPKLSESVKDLKSRQFERLDDKSLIKIADQILNQSNKSLLSDPIAQQDERKVQFLVNNGANLNLLGPDGKSPLLKIVLDKTHDDAMGAFLIRNDCLKGANPAKLGDQFRKAISNNMPETLKELIHFGVDPDISAKAGLTPLMFIALSSMDEDAAKEMIGLLVQNGADINRTDDNGATALIRAAKEGTSIAIMKMLADVPHCDINAVDGRGLSALHYCFSTMSGLDSEDKASMLEHLIEKSGQMASFIENLPLSNEDRSRLMHLANTEPKLLAQPESQEIIAEAIDRKLLLRVRGLMEQPLPNHAVEECKQFRESCTPIEDMAVVNRMDPERYSEFMKARAGKSTTLENAGDEDDPKKMWIQGEERIREMALKKEPMTKQIICELNALVNPDCNPGEPRSKGVEVCIPGADTELVPGKYVEEELDRFVKWINESLELCDKGKMDPIMAASSALQRLVSIHPFGDGNGRTSRYMMDYVLQRYGLPPAAMSNVNVIVFSMRTKNVTPEETVNLVKEGIRNSYQMLGMKTENKEAA